MPNLIRARVCAIGSEEDMKRLCRALLENCNWLDEPEEDMPEFDLQQLQDRVAHHSRLEGGEDCGFHYGMVAGHPYGDALEESCRLTISHHAAGLWAALFTYDSETAFQPEDWLRLHRQCRLIPMVAMYASWDFGLEKGMKVFAGGRTQDDWSRMGPVWLWLFARYQWGYPPEEGVVRLRKLSATMDREEFDLSIGELLLACRDNLSDLAAQTHSTEELRTAMQQCRADKDFDGLFSLYCLVAESVLWETEHAARYLACLDAMHQAWCEAEGEDA